MKGDTLTESDIDALAIKMLDYYADGEYGYEEGVNKTIKQRNLKRTMKEGITEMNSNTSGKVFMTAMHDCILSLIEPCKLRNEVKILRDKMKQFESREENNQHYAMTIYKDEIYDRVKEERDQALVEDLESSRNVNRKLMSIIAELERKQAETKDHVPPERLKQLQNENFKLAMDIAKNKKNAKMSKKQKKMEQLKKQMEALESSDEEDIEIITEEL